MIKFTVDGELPTLNEIVEASKGHWGQYAKMKKKYTQLVKAAAHNMPQVKYANFDITWYCKNRRKDKDNIMGGQKFIFDGLVEAGIIENDGWKQVGDISHSFKVDKENPRIEVLIWN